MADRWATPWRLSAGVVCGAAVLLGAPAVASADSDGFSIVNRSGTSLKLQKVTFSKEHQPFEVMDGIARRPLEGLVLKSDGTPLDVELSRPGSSASERRSVGLEFSSPQGAKYNIQLAGYDPKVPIGQPERGMPHAECTVSGPNASLCEVDHSTAHPTIRVSDPPGTTRTIAAEDTQTQLRIVWDLCRSGERTCVLTWEETEPLKTFGPSQVVGQPILNCGDAPVNGTYAFSETAFSTSTIGGELGVSVKADFLVAMIKASISIGYTHEWGHSQEFTQKLDIKELPARHVAWVELSVPIKRSYATINAQANNTSWILEHARFDAPDPDPNRVPALAVQSRPATSSELAACDKRAKVVRLRPAAIRIGADRV